jgi:hypothetical protein
VRRLALAVGLLALAWPAVAGACDESTHAGAAAGPDGVRAPLLLGDSTLYFSVERLARLGIEADAKGCRTVDTGLELERARLQAGTLPDLLILALGANGGATAIQIDAYLREIGPSRVLGLVTPKLPATAAEVFRAEARAHPRRVILMDWARFSAAHPEWFSDDGLHVGRPGARAYASFIRAGADPLMPPTATRLGLPRTARDATDCGARVYVVRGARLLSCRRAQVLARRSPLQPVPGWHAYDWGRARGGGWASVYRRDDGRVLVATRQNPR